MKKGTLIKAAKTIIPIAFGIFLIWLTYNKTSPTDRATVIRYIREADYFWVGVSVFLGFLSHCSRAYRWKFTLAPLGYSPKFLNSLMAVIIAYFANLGIPRSGEILRATTLTTYEGVPFEKAFGTIVAERIADVIMGLIIILIALFVHFDSILFLLTESSNFLIEKISSHPQKAGGIIIIILLLVFGIRQLLRKFKNAFTTKIKTFVIGLKEGVLTILSMKKRGAFIFHTVFIWTMYLLMFYAIFFTIEETRNSSLAPALISFVTGSLTIATTNGGLGSYPLVIQETLSVFDISMQSGLAIGWIMWTAQTALTTILGICSFFFLPIYNRIK